MSTSDNSEKIRHERDQYRILVDITNSVLSHLEMDGLVAEVSREIYRFFGISQISVALCDNDSSAIYLCYSSYYQRSIPVEKTQYHLTELHPDLTWVLETNKPLRLTLAQETHDPLYQQVTAQGMTETLLLPLAFNHKPLGVLVLSHENNTIFTDDNCNLLKQIAARFAIAVDNAAAYGEITHLKDSLKNENLWLNEQIHNMDSFSEIIFQSEAMRNVLEQVDLVAPSDSTVLILGETGTGKELIARAIHRLSQRHQRAIIKMNCAAIPSGLLESDLFGHDKGAFTGATTTHIGRFEMADKSTLFLDEIGDMPLELQPKLLRVLQEREIERIGGNKIIPVDVRLIAATNRDLKGMTEEREFREDLYYRLNVFPITIPPLRERPEDIPLLATYFTKKIAQRMNRKIDCIPRDALAQLSLYPWPGNVRELENVIERAVILTRGNTLNLQLHELNIPKPSRLKNALSKPSSLEKRMQTEAPESDDEERNRIIEALKATNGVVAGARGAATRLGLKRTTLLSRMQRLGISVQDLF
ncbi:sigma 54-interacting transcriptional regulator [Providencia heimbachae]|uniref:Formate hydrogenlyase transcriptional activator n=1 Tax=Providencia heimbachae ATCC 35613 TaxID=1354272 RepID=A0A1B7JLD8_9GAMM|nr:sigma 54-interacting transcriptional regulator [Providencia heimbachae]OAT48728.1 formate hydrogenlyase transcriptional activator [Providencia heimbachae ATCC 35613]QCJ71959.1 formate hydrogenlyase [Providencia heimbachae]SQH12450.1 Formate hydrogenlyase transcriptional activator [Providencia heimbachae]